MDKTIAFCGLICSACPAYIAKKDNNDELRKKTAEEWSKQFNAEMKPEDINCDGCNAVDGVHIGYCNICEIRKCAIGRGVENCAYCTDYACEKLEKFISRIPDAKKRLEDIRKAKQA
jgi:hypothetical protein